MTQEQKDLLLKDLCARLPYDVKCSHKNEGIFSLTCIDLEYNYIYVKHGGFKIGKPGFKHIKPYLFPMSSMTDEDHTIYSKIWEDTGKTAYLEGCHHLISTIKAYKAANDYLLSKHYDINGLIPMGLANDATGLNIY